MNSTQLVSLDQIDALSKYLEACEQGSSHALEALGELSDSDSVRRRAKVLLDLGRADEAASLLGPDPADFRQFEQSLRADIRVGRFSIAVARLHLRLGRYPDIYTARACAIIYHELLDAVATDDDVLSINLDAISPDARTAFEQLIDCTAYVVARIPRRHTTLTTVNRLVCLADLQLALAFSHTQEVENAVSSLAQCRPFPLELANYAGLGLLRAEPSWVEAILTDHPESVEAYISANLINAYQFGQAQVAFENLLKRVDSVDQPIAQASLFAGLHQLSNLIGPDARKTLKAVAGRLLKVHADLRGLFDAEVALTEGATASAEKLLADWQDNSNPMWIQLAAQLARVQQNHARAIDVLQHFVKDHTNIPILTLLASIAWEAKDYVTAKEALARLVRLDPRNAALQFNLGLALVQLDDKPTALPHLAAAAKHSPENSNIVSTYAQCLVDLGDTSQARAVLSDYIERDAASLVPRLQLANILTADGKSVDAHELLDAVKDDFADDPRFLTAYIESAYRSNRDDAAHQAFIQLKQLQDSGKLESDVLQSASLDELITLTKQHRERVDGANTKLLSGQLPWLGVATIENNVPFWAWAIRTQKLAWIADRPPNIAAYSVYATNAVTAVSRESSRELEEIQAPQPGLSVTIDMTALITVFQLGLFDKLPEYFSRIFVPSIYLEKSAVDKPRLQPHQLSQRVSLETLRHAVTDGRLKVVDSNATDEIPVIDEYDDDAANFRLADVLSTLNATGRLSRRERESLERVSHKPASGKNLYPGAEVAVDLATLKTVVNAQVFDVIARRWQLRITAPDWEEAQQTLRTFDFQEEIYRNHDKLWDKVRHSGVVTLVPTEVVVHDSPIDRTRQTFSLSSIHVAQATESPLFADDRFLQQLVLNSVQDSPTASFGTDAWLCALLDQKLVSEAELARKYADLMKYRYKFLLPSTQMLVSLVNLYPDNVPNEGLRDIAGYIHMCLRDPGLYAGPEKVQPEVSVAVRLHLLWLGRLGAVLAHFWSTVTHSEEFAERLTKWVTEACIPSAPQSLGTLVGAQLSWRARNALLSHFAAASMGCQDVDETRMANGFRCLKDSLELSDDQYIALISRLVVQD